MKMWQTIRGAALGWHKHQEKYAALVLSGAYEEAGDQGRFRVGPGDVVLHDRFEAHVDRFPVTGARVLNLRLAESSSFKAGVAKVSDVDLVVRTAELDEVGAAEFLLEMAQEQDTVHVDWPDELATMLIKDPSVRLGAWAEKHGLAAWDVSRGFAKVFGISPAAFRARARARLAWKAIRGTEEPLAVIAADLGFADQSHMTRSVNAMTGAAPGAWRSAANGFKTRSRTNV